MLLFSKSLHYGIPASRSHELTPATAYQERTTTWPS
jgi:hypothetical protein